MKPGRQDNPAKGMDSPDTANGISVGRSSIAAPWSGFGRGLDRLADLATVRRVVVPTAIIVAWVLVSTSDLIRDIFLPSPGELWEAFQGLESNLGPALQSSVLMVIIGWGIGTSLGISLGLFLGYSKIMRELFGGVLDFVRPVPIFALIPLFILWFGIGKSPQITLIALGTSVILGVTTVEAIKNVNPVHIRAGLTLGANRRDIYRTVIVPSIFPHLLGAIRVSAAAAWGLDVAAEFIGAQEGLGYLMIIRQQYLDTASLLLIVIIYSVLAVGFDYLIRLSSRPALRWTERGSRTGVVASIVGQT